MGGDMTELTITAIREHRTAIRQILKGIGWAEQYIVAAEAERGNLLAGSETYGVYLAMLEGSVVGFVYVRLHTWNQLRRLKV
jgi:hypothetical protein